MSSSKPSNGDIAQRKNLCLVTTELGSVVDDALADGLEVPNSAVAEVRQEVSEPADIALLLLFFVITISTKLKKNLVICHETLC